MGEKRFDFGAIHLFGMPLVMEEDVPFDPRNVALLSSIRVVLQPNAITNLVKELLGLRGAIAGARLRHKAFSSQFSVRIIFAFVA
jgi:hypothetical protein